MSTLFEMGNMLDTVIHGEALEVLKNIPDNCVDAICCDPPAGISFMNKEFDHNKGGRTQWVAWLSGIMREARRCLRPGGHALVWSLPRTSHWTALALEDAGFEIRDNIYNLVSGDTALHTFIQSLSEEQQHAFMQVIDQQRETSGVLNIFGQGFPKSLDLSKAIDRMLGKEREILGPRIRLGDKKAYPVNGDSMFFGEDSELPSITAPSSEAAKQYAGYGTALKPAVENWWLVRKPLAAHSIAENVLEYGTGGLNIDATRVGHDTSRGDRYNGKAPGGSVFNQGTPQDEQWKVPSGRFPSHLLLSHTIFCQQSGTKRVQANGPACTTGSESTKNAYGDYEQRSRVTHRDEDGMETVTNWICDESCPVKILDEQSGTSKSRVSIRGKAGNAKFNGKYHNGETYTNTADQLGGYSDSGGPSRYFQQFPALDDVPPYVYAGKASRRDRTADNTVNNTHPTVKNISMLRYFVRLLCPPNGIVLDMFGGSGSTGVACIHEGFHYILVEKELEYITIARSRIEHAIATVGAKPQPPPATKSPTLLRPRHKTTNTQPTLWDKEITS